MSQANDPSINRSTLVETVKSALEATDLRSVDAMFQTFEEIAQLWGGDFTVAEAGALEPGGTDYVSVEMYRNEPESDLFYLTITPEGWALDMFNEPGENEPAWESRDTAAMAEKLATLVYQ